MARIVLTERERQCLIGIARGKTAGEVAREIGTSESTVVFHLGNVCRKLGATNRCHAVAKAIEAKLIEL